MKVFTTWHILFNKRICRILGKIVNGDNVKYVKSGKS